MGTRHLPGAHARRAARGNRLTGQRRRLGRAKGEDDVAGPTPLGSTAVLFYDHCARMSGAEISLLNTAGAMSRAPTVLLGERGPLEAALRRQGVASAVLELPAETRNFSRRGIGANLGALRQAISVIGYSLRLARAINRLAPAVIVSNSMKSHVILSFAKPFLRAPIVFYLHDRISVDFMSRGGVLLERALVRYASNGIIANSLSTMNTAPTSKRQLARAIIGGPVAPLPPGKGAATLREGKAERFGMVGRISPWKGQDLAIRAFGQQFKGGSETLEIVGGALFGEDGYAEQLTALVVELNLGAQVTFTGHVDDVYERMAKWDCVVHASIIPEPFGLVVVQAMVAGIPVIASGEGGPAEVIRDGENGFLFEPRSQSSLAAVMGRVAVDYQARVGIARTARSEAEAFLPDPVARQVEAALSAVAGRSI